jgi:hypothetical protein
MLDFRYETPEEEKLTQDILQLSRDIEQQQNQEDEEMLIRLIKIRRSLWT